MDIYTPKYSRHGHTATHTSYKPIWILARDNNAKKKVITHKVVTTYVPVGIS